MSAPKHSVKVSILNEEYTHRSLLEDDVRAGVGDIALGPVPESWDGPVDRLGWEELIVVLPSSDPLAGAGRLALETLADRPWILFQPGHGLTEVVYAYTSMANNNGSAFAGLGTAARFYQITGGITMLLGRFGPEIFALGLAGSLARQAPVPVSAGTLDTRKPLFVGMLVGAILILVGLTYFPALALGPFAEGLH